MSLSEFIEIDPLEILSYFLNKNLRKEKQVTLYYNLERSYIRLDDNIGYSNKEDIMLWIRLLKEKYKTVEHQRGEEIAITIYL
ncbi:MAG: hypothetical protein DSO07_10180 [Thermoproteota archaeon]|jgi:hypothetical protein|uniref:Uncharacterized protein n=1 Tax=Candidatus Methanodesulfokora washburnensis TaxID=2478471 RepID=A0A429GX95_9CREN|nr:hypothetical protein [Candidatus Methanodesulfokores washburnensis]RSN78351.1 hypothetical protein D6D85_01310 [Candidatus Methanodesulfokores washburnensis]TDA39699.1 MAG: hypothetical protein DSO07_10180 [Candidatus Korarchaeota archaeon]